MESNGGVFVFKRGEFGFKGGVFGFKGGVFGFKGGVFGSKEGLLRSRGKYFIDRTVNIPINEIISWPSQHSKATSRRSSCAWQAVPGRAKSADSAHVSCPHSCLLWLAGSRTPAVVVSEWFIAVRSPWCAP